MKMGYVTLAMSNSKRSFTSDGLTIYHHLQAYILAISLEGIRDDLFKFSYTGLSFVFILHKYRLAKYLPESPSDGSKDENKGSGDAQANIDPSSQGLQIDEALRMQMEVQKRLHEQLEVQKQLQMRIEAQGKYLQKIIEEQEKLGSVMRVSDTLPSNEQDDLKNKSSESQPDSEDSPAPTSPLRKKHKVGHTQALSEINQKQSFVDQWDQHLYEINAEGIGIDLDTDFRKQENSMSDLEGGALK